MIGGIYSVGAFGKLPMRGDFLRRGFSPKTVHGLDDWLQNRLSQTPPNWRPDAAPPWRFLAAPGVFGPHGLLGVMAPSCDSVGRQFPFTVAIEFHETEAPPVEIDTQWLDRCERAIDALHRLGRGHTIDPVLAGLRQSSEVKSTVAIELAEHCSIWWHGSDIDARLGASSAPDPELFANMMDCWTSPGSAPEDRLQEQDQAVGG